MGSIWIQGFQEMTDDIDVLLTAHLQGNHYPPVSTAFIPACKKAIDNANDGVWDEKITLPNGRILTTGAIIDGLHLDCFLDQWEEE